MSTTEKKQGKTRAHTYKATWTTAYGRRAPSAMTGHSLDALTLKVRSFVRLILHDSTDFGRYEITDESGTVVSSGDVKW